jgi:hypothetical membrane protein
MTQRHRLLFGPLAAAIFFLGVVGLALMIPGYSQVHQTVSEIGQMGSPARTPFMIMLFAVALCILVFAWAVREVSVQAGHSPLAAYFMAFMAVSVVGVGIFAHPHPFHNYFGLSEVVAYQAPLVMALTWRGDARGKHLATVSWVVFVLMWIVIGLNLSTLDRQSALFAFEKPFYGLVQRSLFVVWFGWLIAVAVLLFSSSDKESVVLCPST